MKNNFKAVTLIETLVTLFAISFMIAGPVFFVSRSYAYSQFIQDKIVATGLSQEGLELVTSLRNNSTTAFASIIDTNCLASFCKIYWNGESADINVERCEEGDDSCRLYSTESEPKLSHTNSLSGHASKYYRALIINKNPNSLAYTIDSKVWSKEDAVFKLDVSLRKIIYAK